MTEAELTKIWIESIARIAPDTYRAVPDIEWIPRTVRANSAQWAGRFFVPEADPHQRPTEVQWSYHLATERTPDVIRYIYRALSYDLDAVESRAYAVIRLKLRQPPASAIQEAADKLLLRPAPLSRFVFQFPQTLSDGIRFSSNPETGPLEIASWEDLVEGGIRGGAPYFLRFKKHPQIVGYPNLRTWFDPEFRTANRA